MEVHELQLLPVGSMQAAIVIVAFFVLETSRSTTLSVPSWLVTHRQPYVEEHGLA